MWRQGWGIKLWHNFFYRTTTSGQNWTISVTWLFQANFLKNGAFHDKFGYERPAVCMAHLNHLRDLLFRYGWSLGLWLFLGDFLENGVFYDRVLIASLHGMLSLKYCHYVGFVFPKWSLNVVTAQMARSVWKNLRRNHKCGNSCQ